MKIKGILLLTVVVGGLFSLTPAFANRKGDFLPAPKLRAPNDEAVLTGKEYLEFRWSSEGSRADFQYYDFRVYKGSQTYEAGLIFKEKVPAGQTTFQVKSDLFENGQTYAWSLKQVGGRKGRENYSIFKVTK